MACLVDYPHSRPPYSHPDLTHTRPPPCESWLASMAKSPVGTFGCWKTCQSPTSCRYGLLEASVWPPWKVDHSRWSLPFCEASCSWRPSSCAGRGTPIARRWEWRVSQHKSRRVVTYASLQVEPWRIAEPNVSADLKTEKATNQVYPRLIRSLGNYRKLDSDAVDSFMGADCKRVWIRMWLGHGNRPTRTTRCRSTYNASL